MHALSLIWMIRAVLYRLMSDPYTENVARIPETMQKGNVTEIRIGQGTLAGVEATISHTRMGTGTSRRKIVRMPTCSTTFLPKESQCHLLSSRAHYNCTRNQECE